MSWWEYVVVAAVLLAGVYAFLALTRFATGFLSHGSDNTADTMYANYAGSTRKQRRNARQHAGERKDDEGARSRNTVATLPSARSDTAARHPDGLASRAA